jgi:hypothetical protein
LALVDALSVERLRIWALASSMRAGRISGVRSTALRTRLLSWARGLSWTESGAWMTTRSLSGRRGAII